MQFIQSVQMESIKSYIDSIDAVIVGVNIIVLRFMAIMSHDIDQHHLGQGVSLLGFPSEMCVYADVDDQQ